MLCIKCKKEIPEGSKFCNHCGAKQEKKARRRADGNLEKSIVVKGKRKTFYAKTEREMNQKIAAFMGEAEKVATKLFGYYAEELERSWDSLAFNTVKGYKPSLARCCEKFGDLPVGEISPYAVKLFLEGLGKTFSQKSVSTHKSLLSQIFDIAIIDGAITTNPAAVKFRQTGKKKNPRDAASEDAVQIIEEHWDEDLYSFLGYFIVHTGLRRGECVALQYGDIDIEGRRITVKKAAYFDSNMPRIKETKTEAGVRCVILPDLLAEKMAAGNPRQYIFSSTGGKEMLCEHEVRNGWQQFCERHGLGGRERCPGGKTHFVPSVSLHQLRHYYATKCYEMGLDKGVVQAMMGHTDYGITENYTHIREQTLKAAESIINKQNP